MSNTVSACISAFRCNKKARRAAIGQERSGSVRNKNSKWYPHQLIMTATPIPRTLAMTAYADLDTSVIDELPAGRTPVETAVVPKSRRDEVVEAVPRRVPKDSRRTGSAR